LIVLNQDFGLKYKFTLLVLFASMAVFGSGEYTIILERFVKLICPSCIGL